MPDDDWVLVSCQQKLAHGLDVVLQDDEAFMLCLVTKGPDNHPVLLQALSAVYSAGILALSCQVPHLSRQALLTLSPMMWIDGVSMCCS